MVRNIKIKHFLIISFIAILALTVVLGLFALTFTQKLASETKLFYEHPHTVELEVAQVRLDMANIGSEIRGAMVVQTPERTQKTTEFIATTMADITERVAIVKKQFTGDQQILLDTDAIVVEWVAAIDKIRPLMEQEQYDEAIKVFQTEYQPQEQRLSASCDSISDHSSSVSKSVYDDAVETQVIARVVTFSLLIFNILLTIVICSVILKSITVPLKKVKEAAEAMASGDLHQNVDFSGKNEFGLLAQSMNKTTCTLAAYVDNIDTILGKMSDNDMTVTVDMDYVGDFAPIKASLQRIINSLNHTLEQIESSTEQVAASAQQMSYSSQTLSQGAAEQAASVEELSANISEISAQVQQNAGTTGEMLHLVNFVGTELERGNGQMGQMLGAINEINTASDQIAKIIKTIEDIAFQTNILALNASVEAARAGTAGKGFAVVADEVRSLAGKSSDAAKNTTTLISNSIQAVQNGTKIAHDTAATLKSVVDGAQKITDMVTQISESSDQQAGALTQITGAVAQISQVIQTNSATSEESAAASQELNGQANVLEESVRRFQLRRTDWRQTSTALNSPAIRRK